MKAVQLKNTRRKRRRQSTRAKLRRVSPSTPRLSVFRSAKHISAQVIDDASGRTLAAATTTSRKLAGELDGKTKTERAAIVGREVARLAREKGVEAVCFDRGFARYHGRVKALADAAREGGLRF